MKIRELLAVESIDLNGQAAGKKNYWTGWLI